MLAVVLQSRDAMKKIEMNCLFIVLLLLALLPAMARAQDYKVELLAT